MISQQGLFGAIETIKPETERRKRHRIAEQTFDKQAMEWKRAVLAFAETIFLRKQSEPFLAENLREAYEMFAKENKQPQATVKQAWAGIFVALKKKKLIRTAGAGMRKNGVLAVSYEVVK